MPEINPAHRWSILMERRPWMGPAIVYFVLAWTFANLYYYVLPNNLVESVQVLSAFHARKPMQLRVLVPAIIHLISSITPLSVSSIDKYLLIASAWGILMLFASFLALYIPKSRAWVSAPLILIPMIWNFCLLTLFHYPSDLPAIVFLLGCVVLWRSNRRWAYYACFMLACFNRETILFILPCLFALDWSDRRLKFWMLHTALHLAIFGAVKLVLWKLFEHSPGAPVEDHLEKNLAVLLDFITLRNGAPRYFLFLFGGLHLAALALLRWAPRELQRLTVVTILFWAGMIYAGILLESRIFGELIPIYTAIVIVVAARFWPTNGKQSYRMREDPNRSPRAFGPKRSSGNVISG
jgi:hypothetical protein